MILRSVVHYRVLLLGCLLTVTTGVALMAVSLEGVLATAGPVAEVGPEAVVRVGGQEFRAGRDTPDPGGLLTVLLLSTAVTGLLTAGVTATTLGLAVSLRRRDLALLRLAGSSRWQLRRLVVGEALVVAVPAALLGVLLGRLLSGPVIEAVSQTGLAGIPIRPEGSWTAGAGAALLGLLTAALAGWAASARAVAVSPSEALRDADVDRQLLTVRGGLAGAVLMVGGVVMLAVATGSGEESAIPLAVFGTVAVTAALGLLGPVLLPPLVGVLAVVLRGVVRTVPVELGTRSLVAGRRRTASLLAPTLALLAVIGVFSGVLSSVAASGAADGRARTTAEVVATRADGQPLTAADRGRLGRLAGVRAVAAPGTLPALSAAGGVVARELVQVGDPVSWAATHTLPLVAGELELRAPEEVLVSAELAGFYALGPGQEFELGVFGGPTTRVRIRGVVDSGPAATAIFAGPGLPGAETAAPASSADLRTGRSAADLSAELGPGDLVLAAAGRAGPVAGETANQQVLAILAVPGALFSLVAVTSTAVMTIDRRRGEIATLRRLGASPGTVLGQLVVEGLVIGVVAVGLAALLVTVGVLSLRSGLASSYLATEVAVPWSLLAPLAGVAVLAGVLAHLLAGAWVLRRPGRR